MVKAAKKPRTGRPPRHDDERLRKIRSFRVRPSLDKALLAAAKQNGLSVSEQIEKSLDASLDTTALLSLLGAERTPNQTLAFLGYVARVLTRRPIADWANETERKVLKFSLGLLVDAVADGFTIERFNAALAALPQEIPDEIRDAMREGAVAAFVTANPREEWARTASAAIYKLAPRKD
jgi:hypothetical protein